MQHHVGVPPYPHLQLMTHSLTPTADSLLNNDVFQKNS
jgi:hypothetical protein